MKKEEDFNIKIGDVLFLNINEFDTVRPYSEEVIVTKVDLTDYHAIGKNEDGMEMWIDSSNIGDLFTESPLYPLLVRKE